ncbi:DUF2975 domain-containing protein [Pontibacter sp. KCTC 32443]|uniref:DUF2975 domain-containing protein n=1 Tax=Pontibacter TaxID=323449 RepID=UPI00164DFB55|nr:MULTISPECIES: DUF2975 domain-containing protein [Pontibacter]MBC5775342.1 DUF2975 domain-containing protein [Pontibacter sp. KCTC 32443]
MEKNRLLTLALVISNIAKVFFVLLIAAMSGVLVHWHISPETYKNVLLTIDSSNEVRYIFKNNDTITGPEDSISIADTGAALSQISNISFYFHFLQTVGHFIILILIVNQVTRIIRSVKALETFRGDNSQAFRKIGIYCVALALLGCIKWFEVSNHTRMSFSVGAIPLAFALGAFILAEIFKEGNKLYEAEQLTI